MDAFDELCSGGDAFRRSFSFESYNDFVFDDRLFPTTLSATSSQDPLALSQSSSSLLASDFLNHSASSQAANESSNTKELLTSYDASDLLCTIHSGEKVGESSSDRAFVAQNQNAEVALKETRVSRDFCIEPAGSIINETSTAVEKYAAKGSDPKNKLSNKDKGTSKLDVKSVFERFKTTSHVNYFSFIQHLMIYHSTLKISDFIQINESLLKSSCFQRNNYWLRIAPEIISFLYYTIDYLSGNCPNAFYHRCFNDPLKYKRAVENFQEDTITWEKDLIDDEMLLTWTDIWWSCRYMSYTPRDWRPNLSHKLPQCQKLAHIERQKNQKRSLMQKKRQLLSKSRSSKSESKGDKLPKRPNSATHDLQNRFSTVANERNNLIDLNPDLFLNHGSLPDMGFTANDAAETALDSALDPILYFSDNNTPTCMNLPSPSSMNFDLFTFEDFESEGEKDLLQTTYEEIINEHSHFHKQEQARFRDPTKDFTYTLSNMKTSTVGPTYSLRVAMNDHSDYQFLADLINQEVNSVYNVYLIDLIRDAAARLPNGEGSRSEIVNLFKQSQFVNQKFVAENDNLVNGIVGKYLEVLKNFSNPCVDLTVDGTGKCAWRYLPTIKEVSMSETCNKSNSRSSNIVTKLTETARQRLVNSETKLLGFLNDHYQPTTDLNTRRTNPSPFNAIMSNFSPTAFSSRAPKRGRPKLSTSYDEIVKAKQNSRSVRLDFETAVRLSGPRKEGSFDKIVVQRETNTNSRLSSVQIPQKANYLNSNYEIPYSNTTFNNDAIFGAMPTSQSYLTVNPDLDPIMSNNYYSSQYNTGLTANAMTYAGCNELVPMAGIHSPIAQCANPIMIQNYSVDYVS